MQQVIPARVRHVPGVRADVACAVTAAVLVAAAFAVPQIRGRQWSEHLYAAAAPIFGIWEPHIGWGTGPAILIAVLVVLTGPELARRLPWRPMLLLTWVGSVAWIFSLAMIDGWQVGFAGRLARHEEYVYEAGRVTDVGAMLRGFSGRILDFQPDSWATHVSGHPAGALLTFVLMDRIGLRGGAWAAWLVVLAGAGAAVAVAVTLRALGAEDRARAAMPYLILAPAAVWLGVSADALFAGVTAWAVALLAIATRRGPGWAGIALASGLLFGYGLFLNYGLTLMVIPAAAVLCARGMRAALPAVAALIGVALVVAAFTAAGFWWLDGYHLVVQRYYQGIASERPYSYWIWGNLAATVCSVGLAAAAALHRVVRGVLPGVGVPASEISVRGRAWRAWLRWQSGVDPAALLAAAGVLAIVAADLSGLSKAETERIWLPFDMWVLAGTALLPVRQARIWLTLQAVAALSLNHLLMTNW
ncbi:hypothetical protein [Nocardia miyunensis]|uniref:hypothetical protein n=1 Tax=Nocardia miyunensis TaxID=282684 RepID=UPI000AE7B259|nr:hypothetical protein [Nocardia miyunensis]